MLVGGVTDAALYQRRYPCVGGVEGRDPPQKTNPVLVLPNSTIGATNMETSLSRIDSSILHA